MTLEINWDNPDEVEWLLANEWLWDIDNEFRNNNWNLNTDSLCISKARIEKIYWVEIQIISDTNSIIINREWTEIWRLEISEYNHEWLEEWLHMYKSVSTEERWKWIASAMFELYVKAGFEIPKNEYSDKKSWLWFLLSTWYYEISWTLSHNWETLDSDTLEIYEILSEESDNDELWITVVLSRKK